MEIQRILTDSVELAEIGWRAVAEDIHAFGGTIVKGDTVEGIGLIDAVLDGTLSTAQLKEHKGRTRHLDGEATKLLGDFNIEGIDVLDRLEGLTRKVAFLASKHACETVGSSHLRSNYIANAHTQIGSAEIDRQAMMLGIDKRDITRIRILRVK